MSREIDERVVEMRFDNKQFEANVATSMSTLEKLKKSLDLDGAAKGFDSLSDAAGKCNVSALGQAAEAVSTKFSALETIAVGALLKIGNQAVTAGEHLLKSLTVDNIMDGWNKYADKTTAVQTIMAATGKSIDEVNDSLEKLIWFTDETSYSMTDMTSNIGKFTSQGVDLDTAVTAMQGISTWASLSGGSINEASRAMYNLSQALGVGAVKLQDWKSIENANMATKEFKEMAMEAAVETGNLTKSFDAAGNAIYKTSKGTEVTAANFSSTLQDAWFSSDALIAVLNNYGAYADGVYELYNNLADGVSKTTSEIIQDLKDLKGADDQTILNAGYTEDQIELVRRLSEEVGGVGQKSFAAAQEAKTFSEVLGSVKEAVGSGWAQTFETIFGNYEEAKVLWTDLANELYDVFAEGGNARNELLSEALSVSGFDRFTSVVQEAGIELDTFQEKLGEISETKGISLSEIIDEYGSLEEAVQNGAISTDLLREAVVSCAKELDGVDMSDLQDQLDGVIDGIDDLTGREHLISAFWNTWEGVRTLLSTFKDAFREIFPATTADQLYNFVKGLDELTGRFKAFLTESEEGQKLLTDLKNTFKGVFAVLDIIKTAFTSLWRAISPGASAVGGLLSGILGLTGSFGEWLSNLDETIKKNDIFYKGFKTVVDFIKGAITIVKNFALTIGEKLNFPSLTEAKESVKAFLDVVKDKVGAPGLELLHGLFENLCTRAKQVKDAIVSMKDGITDSFDKIDGAVAGSKFLSVLTGIWEFAKKVGSAIMNLFGSAISGLINMLSHADFKGILDFLNTLVAGGFLVGLKKFLDMGNELKGSIGGFFDWAKQFGEGINNILDGVRGCLEAWQQNIKATAILKIAGAVAILAAGLLVLSTIDSEKLTGSLVAVTTLFVELMAAMGVMDKLDIDSKAMSKTATAMIKIGAALLILSFTMKNLGSLDPEQLAEGLIGVGVLLAEIAAFLKVADFEKGATKAATGMVIFAAAIKILASAVKDLSALSWGEMAKGLVGVGVLLAEVDVFLNTAKFSGKSILTATGIVILSSAIKILASAVKDFGGMSWGEITKGLASIAVLLTEITAFTRLTGDAKHVIATGLALIEIATAMKIFASAMQSFGAMSWQEIAKGLVAMGGALGEVAIATKLMPKNMVTMGIGLISVGAALKVIASALGSMGNMSWEEIAKGLVAMGGALAELSIALNLMNGTLGGSAALLVAAGALAVLIPVLVILGKMSWESIAKGLITIAGAFTVIGVAGALLSPLAGSILALSAALAIIGVSAVAIGAGLVLIGAGLTSIAVGLTSLATALSASVTVIVAGLTAIIVGIAGLIPAIAEKIGEAIVAFCGIIANGAPAIAEAVKAVVLSLVDVLVTCVPAIADGALQLVVGVLAALVSYTPQIIDLVMQFLIEVIEGIARNLPQLIQAAMDLIDAFFAGVLSALSNIDAKTLIEGVAAVGLLTALVAALGLIAGLVPAAMVGVLGVGAVITELAVVLAAIGGLAQIPGLEWLISEGGQFLQTIGTAIGGFVGGIVGGFMGGVSSSFPQIGADLSAFMTNVQPFIDGANKISPDLLSGIATLTGAILLITAADLLEGLTSWLTGGSSLADFGNELVPFGESMVAFSNTISGLDADLVDKAATAGKTLAEMAATLPNSGGVVGFFTGENDMGEFGEQLVIFGESMTNFADVVKGLDTEAVQNAAIAGQAMAEMAATLPNTGGAVAFFTGDNDMETFGEQLVPFGRAIKEYSEVVAGLDTDAVVNSATAGQALVELANTVPNTGGAVAFFTGDNDLATFGEQIIVFGNAMKEYSEAVAGLDGEAVANSATAGAALVELANTVPNTGGLVSFFTGDNDLATFGEQIVPFGEAMMEYSKAVTGMDTEAVSASTTAALALAELQATLPNCGGVVSFFTGGNDLGTFGEGIKTFGDAMKSYGDSVTGMDTEAVTASATAAQALAELQSSLPNVGGIVSFFTGGNDLSKFAEGLIPFGQAMKSYGASVTGIDTNSITASAIAAQSLAELQSTLPSVGGVMEFFTGGNDLGKFSEGLVPFGEAMKSYSDSVTGINAAAITSSATAAKSLAELQAVLPNVGGVMEFFTGGNDLGTFATGIIPFGEAMKSYGEAVADIDADSITASAIAAQSLAELQTSLPNVGGVMEFFTGGNDLATFAAGIVPFGEAMNSYGNAVTGIDTDAISASAIAAQSLAELQNTLPQIGGVMEFFTGGNDLATFGASLIPFGEAMNSYGTAVSGIDAGAVSASATAGQSLVELAKTLPNCGGLAQVFTGSNSLANFGDDIVAFGKDLSAYADAISNVKPEVVTASANAAQALSNLATGLPDSSLFDKWFGGDQTLASFGKEIASFGSNMGDYYSKVANIDLGKLSGVITEVWSIVDLANGIKSLDTSSMSGFGKALKTMGDNGITEFVNTFSDSGNKVTAAVKGMLTTVSSAIADNKKLATNGMQDVMTSLADVVTKKASEIDSSVTKMMTGVSNTIRNNTNPAKSAMQSVMAGALSAINGYYNQFYSAGVNVGQGFVNGISSKLSAASSAGYSLGQAALTAAKRALDSHSPSKEFIYLGENVGEGLAIGINNGIVPAAQASSDMIGEVLSEANKGVDAFEKWLSEKKYYNEISLKDELAGWEALQKKYVEGSEERIKIDREVYRIQNELVSSTYQASIDWIEEEKYYHRLSTQEELEAYERMQKRYIEGSEERKKIDREVYTLRNQLMAESYRNSMDWIEEEKYYNRMSLADELAAYKRVQSRYAKGTDERKKMDREVYRLEQEIYEAQKQYISDVQRVQTEANQKRLDLEEEYADKVKSINEKLASDIENLNNQYWNSLETRTNSLYQSYSLFDEVKKREEVSGATLLDNLQGQVEEFNEWQMTLDKLSARGVDSALIDELSQMGPSAISQIKALESMSDRELSRYVSLWSVKHALARQQAVGELEDLRIETENNIAKLRLDAEQELEKYCAIWQSKMRQVDIDANAELEQLRKDFGEKVGLIKKDTEAETEEMVTIAQRILEEAGWDETGKQIVAGIKSGIEEEKPSFLDILTQMALDGVTAIKDTLDINSPSRVFQKLGNFTGLGFVKGLSEYADESYEAGSTVAKYATDGLSNAMKTVSDYLNGSMDIQPTIRPVLDLSDVTAGAGMIDRMFYNQRLLALADQTSLAFTANAGNNEMKITVDNNGVVQELRSLRSEMAEMTERMARMQVVLDTGVLVGETADMMDSALGQRQSYRGRGI